MPYCVRFRVKVNGKWRTRELEFAFYETFFDFVLSLINGMREGRVSMIHVESRYW